MTKLLRWLRDFTWWAWLLGVVIGTAISPLTIWRYVFPHFAWWEFAFTMAVALLLALAAGLWLSKHARARR